MPTNPRPDDPAEGSREAVDRQLKRSEQKRATDKDDTSDTEKQQQETKEGGVGSEKAGRD